MFYEFLYSCSAGQRAEPAAHSHFPNTHFVTRHWDSATKLRSRSHFMMRLPVQPTGKARSECTDLCAAPYIPLWQSLSYLINSSDKK